MTVSPGGTATFTVSVSGTAPLTYQWFFEGTNVLASATNESLTLTNVQAADAGGYTVVVTNVAGSATSVVATLTVGVAPTITAQPSSLVVTQGQDAGFTIAASGSPALGYQWMFNGTNLAGATTNVLTLPAPLPAASGGYSAVVTNAYGAVTSSVATLTILVPPSIVTQPTNQHVLPGTSLTLVAGAAGTGPLGYQWFFNGTNVLADAATNTLSLTNVQAFQAGGYSLVVTNAAAAATSSVAQVVVLVAPDLLVSAPAGQGMNPSITFTGLMGASYTLQFKNNLSDSNWTDAAPPLNGIGGVLTLTDTNPVAYPTRFYRVHAD